MRVCVSVTDETTAGIIARMSSVDAADLFEVRADLAREKLDLEAIREASGKPLLFTCLPCSEGGRCPDNDPKRKELLLEAIRLGFDYVDVNIKSGLTDVMAEKAGRGLIVSYHDLDGVPEDLEGLYRRMAGSGADIVKIAGMPRSVADVGRLLAFAERVAVEKTTPLMPIAMGPLGAPARLLGGRHRVPYTFAPAQSGAEAAPGQIPLKLVTDLYRVRDINAATRVYGILGQGIGKSLSPTIHNMGFRALGIDAVYIPLEAETLPAFIRALQGLRLSGFSVTRPYKVEILEHLAQVEARARQCGSVNTVVFENGRMRGFTTDGIGVTAPIARRTTIEGRRAVILGAGGAARSAASGLCAAGANVLVLARDAAKAETAVAGLACRTGRLADLPRTDWDILIQATPVGTAPAVDETLVPSELLKPGRIVLDMVYVPRETRLLREAREAGCEAIEGLEMLLSQAVGQFEAWTGQTAPIDAMREALLAEAASRS